MAQALGVYCSPNGVTNGQIRDIVLNGLRNDVTNRHQYSPYLIAKYLGAAFPCKNVPPVSFGDALGLLRVRAGVEKSRAREGQWRRLPALDDVRESILRKIAAIGRQGEKEKAEAGWTRCEEHECWITPGWTRAADG